MATASHLHFGPSHVTGKLQLPSQITFWAPIRGSRPSCHLSNQHLPPPRCAAVDVERIENSYDLNHGR